MGEQRRGAHRRAARGRTAREMGGRARVERDDAPAGMVGDVRLVQVDAHRAIARPHLRIVHGEVVAVVQRDLDDACFTRLLVDARPGCVGDGEN